MNAYSYDGVTYGIADRAGCSVVYYNKDLFDAAGVGYPSIDWTRDDFLAAAKAIATEGDPADKVWGYVQEDWFPYWMSWIYGGGGAVADVEGNIVVNSPENVASQTFLRDLVSVHGVTPPAARWLPLAPARRRPPCLLPARLPCTAPAPGASRPSRMWKA